MPSTPVFSKPVDSLKNETNIAFLMASQDIARERDAVVMEREVVQNRLNPARAPGPRILDETPNARVRSLPQAAPSQSIAAAPAPLPVPVPAPLPVDNSVISQPLPAGPPTSAPQPGRVLSPQQWAQQFHPEIAQKTTLPKFKHDQLKKEYAQYLAINTAQSDAQAAQNDAFASGQPSVPKLPGNLEGQIGHSIITGAPQEIIDRLEAVATRLKGGKKPPAAPKSLEALAVRDMVNGNYDSKAVRLYLRTKGLTAKGEKEPDLQTQLQNAAIAEFLTEGKMGRFGQAYRLLKAPGASQRPQSGVIPNRTFSENLFGVAGIGGTLNTLPDDKIDAFGALLSEFEKIQPFATPQQTEGFLGAIAQRAPTVDEVLAALQEKRITIGESDRMLKFILPPEQRDRILQQGTDRALPAPIGP